MINFFKSFPIIQYAFVDDGTTITSVDINRNVKAYLDEIDNANAYLYYDIKNGTRPDQVSMELYNTPVYYWTFFLLNRQLLNGLHSWPKTYYELENYINQHYSRTVITNFSRTTEIGTDHLIQQPIIVTPNWQNVDGEVKIFAAGQTVEGSISGATGIIDEVDINMNRIFLTDVTGNFQDETISVIEAEGIDLSVATNPNMTLELKSMISTSQYRVSVEDEKVATHHYIDSNGMKISRTNFSDDTSTFQVTNFEYEHEENDSKSKIRVLNPAMVRTFATKYKKLINA